MFVLGLLTCIVLRAFSAQAKVVTSFNECSSFFYKGKEPEGMDQKAMKICQKLKDMPFQYATLYSVFHRIPLYSAYTLDNRWSDTTGRKDIWHIEPQISNPSSSTDHMVREKDSDVNTIKQYQAVSSDYTKTGYDRGHLNPNSFQCGQGRTATFTLTNAAPMNARFNRVHWNKWESTLRRVLLSKLSTDFGFATAYIVTGTVPSASERIPQRENSLDLKRVTVPSHIWTAVCYEYYYGGRKLSKSFSFGYMGNNQPVEHNISWMSVSDLENSLSKLYSELSTTDRSVRIFEDSCYKYDEDEVEKLINPWRNAEENSKVPVLESTIVILLLTIGIVLKRKRNLRREVFKRCQTGVRALKDILQMTGELAAYCCQRVWSKTHPKLPKLIGHPI